MVAAVCCQIAAVAHQQAVPAVPDSRLVAVWAELAVPDNRLVAVWAEPIEPDNRLVVALAVQVVLDMRYLQVG